MTDFFDKSVVKSEAVDDEAKKLADAEKPTDLPTNEGGEGEAVPVPVIDTDLDDNGKTDDEPVSLDSYIGKYVVVCPTCMNPLFSDIAEGSVFCPVCNETVTIEKAAGKIVDPNASEEPTDNGEDDDFDLEDEAGEFDDMHPEYQDRDEFDDEFQGEDDLDD